jgi:Ca-activated chloride channel family protein
VREPERAGPAQPAAASPAHHAYCHARVEVAADVARTVVTDVFVNDSDAPVKLTYRFPLPNDATIAGFADYRDGQRVEASIGDKAQAKKDFERAESEGKQAGLAETDGAMGFAMTLTPLAPHEVRRVELTYVQTLRPLGAERTFVYPAGFSGDGPAAVFDFSLSLTATRSLDTIECPNQPDARGVRASDLGGTVALERLAVPLERDLVVRWSEATEPLDLATRAVRTAGDEAPYVEARFAFTKDVYAAAAPARDVVFVVDTSLSMSGEALENAKQVALQSLANLEDKDRIALVTFDSVVRSWSSLAAADESAKRRLADELRPLVASGASNLDAAVDRAHELLAASEHPVLVMATDGQPTIGEDVDRLAPATPPEAFRNVHVFVALHNYPSRQKAMQALFPGVTSIYVPSGKAGDAAVRDVARLASAPILEDLRFDVDGLAPDTKYGRVPSGLAVGESVRIVGRAAGPVTVKLSGSLHGTPVSMTQPVAIPDALAPGDPLPVEWARAALGELEAQYRESRDAKLREQMAQIGTKYHLVSSVTSLLAASDSLSPDRVMPGDPEIRVAAPRGATAVRALLPWGDAAECSWNDEEGVWFGRFLVPRGLPDGMYRLRVLMDLQGVTTLRTTLLLRVDGKPPTFALRGVREGDSLRITATAQRDVFDGAGSSLRKDLVDLRSLVVLLGSASFPLERIDDDHWEARVPAPGPGAVLARVVATDYARNTSVSEITVEAAP